MSLSLRRKKTKRNIYLRNILLYNQISWLGSFKAHIQTPYKAPQMDMGDYHVKNPSVRWREGNSNLFIFFPFRFVSFLAHQPKMYTYMKTALIPYFATSYTCESNWVEVMKPISNVSKILYIHRTLILCVWLRLNGVAAQHYLKIFVFMFLAS